jgi:cytochrome d ubiquinol oxidase subunit II
MTTLFIPMMLALLGIVLRGAGFAFRKYAETYAQARLFGAIFAGSSLITPFFLGAVAGAIASGRVPRGGRTDLAERLRARTLAVGVLAGLIASAGLHPVVRDAPTLSQGLRDRGWPLLAMAAVAGAATLVLIFRRRYRVARVFAATAVAAVVTGWGVGQYPWMLVDQQTISEAAGAPATMAGLLFVVGLAVVLILPAFAYLLWLTQSERWSET